jgi:hypothetical protein
MGEYQHYIRTDVNGVVILGFTTGFPEIATPQPGDLLLPEYDVRQFQVELLTPIPRSQFKYKVVDGVMVLRTQQELDAEWTARPPAPKTEIELMQEETTQMNLQIIDLFEQLLIKGVL